MSRMIEAGEVSTLHNTHGVPPMDPTEKFHRFALYFLFALTLVEGAVIGALLALR